MHRLTHAGSLHRAAKEGGAGDVVSVVDLTPEPRQQVHRELDPRRQQGAWGAMQRRQPLALQGQQDWAQPGRPRQRAR